MKRSIVVSIRVIVVTCLAPTGLVDIVRAQMPATGPGAPPDPWILRESFNDDLQGSMWAVHADDPNVCWVTERDGRLELRSTSAADGEFAGYVSQTWRLDPMNDIEMKVDLYYNLRTNAGGWIGFGLIPNSLQPRDPHVSFGIGGSDYFAYYWYEKRDGLSLRSAFVERFVDGATLYISYDASKDELYLSDGGYGRDNAWVTLSDLLQGEWASRPLFLVVGGMVDGMAIGSGQAVADNMLVERGTVVEASLRDVHRFRSADSGTYFYTVDPVEKDFLLTEYADVWTYEGPVYRAFRDGSDSTSRPVHRFWSSVMDLHLYTIDAAEKDKLIDVFADVWIYEGVAFYAYPSGQEPTWGIPVYRFTSEDTGSHFYTASEKEKQALLGDKAGAWTYEGIAWYGVR